MSRSDMINNFLDAMSLIAKDAADDSTTDKTVVMEVVAKNNKSYSLKYTNKADPYSNISSEIDYEIGDFVYVTCMGGLDGDTKIILNKVPSATGAALEVKPEKEYINQSIITTISKVSLDTTTKSRTQTIDESLNAKLMAYTRVHNNVKIAFDITTNFSDQFYIADNFEECNFGLEIIFNNNGTEETVSFDVNNMEGFPWDQSAAHYEIIKTFEDVSNFNGLKELKFFVTNLPNQDDFSIEFSEISLTVVSQEGDIKEPIAQVINLSSDLTLQTAADNIKLYTVCSLPTSESYSIIYKWQRENRVDWEDISGQTAASLDIISEIAPRKYSRIKNICTINGVVTENIINISNLNGFIVNSSKSVENHIFTFGISVSPTTNSDITYKWTKIDYLGNETEIDGEVSNSITVDDTVIQVREEYQGHVYWDGIYLGSTDKFVVYQQILQSDSYALDLSNEMEMVAIKADGSPVTKIGDIIASTKARIYKNEDIIDLSSLILIAPDSYYTADKETLDSTLCEFNNSGKIGELVIYGFPNDNQASYTFTFKYGEFEKDFTVKKIASEEDYSIHFPTTVLNGRLENIGTIRFTVHKRDINGTQSIPYSDFDKYINTPVIPGNGKKIKVQFYSSYIDEDNYTLDTSSENTLGAQNDNTNSSVFVISYANTVKKIIVSLYINNLLWDSESIDFVQDGISFAGIEEYYKATQKASLDENDYPYFENNEWKPNEDGKIDKNGWAKKVIDTGYSETNKYLWNIERVLSSNGTATWSSAEQSSVWGTDGREEVDRKSYYAINSDSGNWSGAVITIVENQVKKLNIPDIWKESIEETGATQGNCIWETEIIEYNKTGTTKSVYYICEPSLVTQLAINGVSESGVSLTTSGLVFKQNTNNETTPSQIHIERNIFGDVKADSNWTFTWQQSTDNSSWKNIISQSSDNNIYLDGDNDGVTVKAAAVADQLYIKLIAQNKNSIDETYWDQCMLTRIESGSKGDDAVNVIWSNPLLTFSADENGVVKQGQFEVAKLHVYIGTVEQDISVVDMSCISKHDHLDVSIDNNNNQVTVTISQDTTLGDLGNTNGEIAFQVTLTTPTNISYYYPTLKWVKNNKGDKGDNAISCYIESAQGNLFLDTLNGETQITLTAKIFSGSTAIDPQGELVYTWKTRDLAGAVELLEAVSGENSNGKTIKVYFKDIKNKSIYFEAEEASSSN